jgi:hypothetical protein
LIIKEDATYWDIAVVLEGLVNTDKKTYPYHRVRLKDEFIATV